MVVDASKVVAIIQVRLGSERLPMKALLPLPFKGGPTVLEHVVNRAMACKLIDTVVVATTDKAADDPIALLCEQHNIDCFRGSSDNVLGRFSIASQLYQADTVVRLTGDNPFVHPDTIDQAVEKHLEKKVAYTITAGLPLGTNIEVVSAEALLEAVNATTELSDLEHVTPFIRRNSLFKKQTLTLESGISQVRLSVDFPSDYALASLLYEKLYQLDSIFNLAAVAKLLEEHPWLASINTHHAQKKVFHSEQEEIKEAMEVLKREGLNRALNRMT